MSSNPDGPVTVSDIISLGTNHEVMREKAARKSVGGFLSAYDRGRAAAEAAEAARVAAVHDRVDFERRMAERGRIPKGGPPPPPPAEAAVVEKFRREALHTVEPVFAGTTGTSGTTGTTGKKYSYRGVGEYTPKLRS